MSCLFLFPKNAAQKQEGFWGTVAGDIGEKLGSGIVGGVAGLAKVSTSRNPILKPGMFLAKMIHGEDVTDPDEIISKWFDKAKELSEKGDYHGLIQDPETGETRKKTYSDLWKEGNKMGAVGEALLTATESAPVSATALLPGGLVIVSASAAGTEV